MSPTARRVHYSYLDYLALEQGSPVRHEYVNGEIYAMAGGTPGHAALAAAVLRLVGNVLPAGCRTYTSDLRVHIAATGLSTYPDATVVCGGSERAAVDQNAVVNPTVLVEVTSPSTEEYDRGEKLRNYQGLSSLREVLIVSHREPRVTLVARDAWGGWTTTDFRQDQIVPLASLSAAIAVDDVYRDGIEDAS